MRKMHSQEIKYGITLERYYVEQSPDSVGTIAYWEAALTDIFGNMPFASIYENLVIRIFDMYHGIIDDWRSQGLITLEDIDMKKDGCQGGSGLYWGGKFDDSPHMLDLAIYRQQPHDPYAVTPPCKIMQIDLDNARQALGHELGHHYMRMCNYGSFATTPAQIHMSTIFNNIRVKHIPNAHEAGAEMFQALCGVKQIKGKYSDKKPHSMTPEQQTFMLTWYWLQGNLNIYSDFTVSGSMCWWQEYSSTLFGWKLGNKGWRGVDRQWKYRTYVNGQWV